MLDTDRQHWLRPGTEINFADVAREIHSTLRLSGVAPSYTLPSLAVIDIFLRAEWGDDPLSAEIRESAAIKAQATAVGAYLGEVLVRRWGGTWAPDPDRADSSRVTWPGGAALCPFECVDQRMSRGAARPILGTVMTLRQTLQAGGNLPAVDAKEEAAQWLEQAESAASLRAWGLAAELAEVALRKAPDDAITLARLADFLAHDPQREDEAFTRYAEALALAPDLLSALAGRAALLAGRGPSPEAFAACDAALAVAPDFVESQLLQGRLLLQAGRPEEALAVFDRLAPKHPKDARVHEGRGLTLDALGRAGEAFEAFRAATDLVPDGPLLLRMAGHLEATGALADAHDLCRRAAAAPGVDAGTKARAESRAATLGDTPPMVLRRARQAAAEGSAAEALALLERLVAADPQNVEALRELSIGLARGRRLDDALDVSARALEADPDDPITIDVHAVILGLLDRFPEAIAAIDSGLTRHAAHVPLLVRRANFAARLGRFEEASHFLQRAVAIDPASVDVTLTLAEALVRAGDSEGALVRARAVFGRRDVAPAARVAARRIIRAIERPDQSAQPEAAVARHQQAAALAGEGRHDDALLAFRDATDLDPGEPALWNSRGSCALAQQRPDEALDCFDRAIELAGDSGPLIGNRARALWALDRVAEAAEAYARWLEIDPENEEASRALEVLGGLPPA